MKREVILIVAESELQDRLGKSMSLRLPQDIGESFCTADPTEFEKDLQGLSICYTTQHSPELDLPVGTAVKVTIEIADPGSVRTAPVSADDIPEDYRKVEETAATLFGKPAVVDAVPSGAEIDHLAGVTLQGMRNSLGDFFQKALVYETTKRLKEAGVSDQDIPSRCVEELHSFLDRTFIRETSRKQLEDLNRPASFSRPLVMSAQTTAGNPNEGRVVSISGKHVP